MSENRIPLAGVIGSPIEHSKSPALHGYWLKRYGISGHYIPMNISRDNLETSLRALPKMGFVGVNVTIPHKEAVLDIADSVTDRAALIGAANTLTFNEEGKIFADNTDGYGFLENLKQGAPDWNAKSGPAAILGAGGASRAVLSALLDAGVERILLANRTKARSEALKAEFGARITVFDWVHANAMIAEAATVVNTTSLGMQGNAPLSVSLDGLQKSTVVTDIVYAPLETELLKTAREVGCATVDGLGMLLYQASPGFERWFGQRPEVDGDLRQAVLSA